MDFLGGSRREEDVAILFNGISSVVFLQSERGSRILGWVGVNHSAWDPLHGLLTSVMRLICPLPSPAS